MKKNIKENLMKIIFILASLIAIACVLLISLFLFANGVPAAAEIGIFKFLAGKNWQPSNDIYGIAPMLLGTLYITAGAIVVGVPIGLLTAIYLAEFCPDKIYRFLKPAISLLAGIPSIIYGFFGLVVIVPITRTLFGGSGKSILTASILLGIMILPTIISVSESAIRAVPSAYKEGSLALGTTREETVFFVVVPSAKSGIMSGVILGIGRAMGETMAVIMVAGNQAAMPSAVTDGIRTLTANIVLEMGYAADLHRGALIATAMVLFIFILIINFLFSLLKGRSKD